MQKEWYQKTKKKSTDERTDDINLELHEYGGVKEKKATNKIDWCYNTRRKNRGDISSIYKKGDKKQCSKRGIHVTNPVIKILGKLIRNRLEDKFDTSEERRSFKALKAGTDHFFIIKQILYKIYDKMKEIHMIFIDLEKAYDNIPKKLLWKAMEITNISKPVINLVKLVYKTKTCQIKKGYKISEKFELRKGLL